MADDYSLTTNEQGQDIYRDTEGRTLSPGDYASTYGPAVMQDMGLDNTSLALTSQPGYQAAGGSGIASLANTSLAAGSSGDGPAYPGDSTGVAAQIDALYQTTFNRPADVSALQYYGAALMNGASIADIEKSLKSSAEYAGIQPGTSGGTVGAGTTANNMGLGTVSNTPVEDELAKYYTSEFGRAFDKPGLDFWAGKIRSGDVALGDVAKLFSTSEEGLKYDIATLAAGKENKGYIDPALKGRYETLQDLYGKETYRKGDIPGLEYWLGRNLTSEQYAKAFAESPEARVQDAYREVFGATRGADEKGLKFYMDQLASGKKYEDIVASMKASDEYKKLTGGVITTPIVTTPIVTKPVVNPITGVTYSNASQSAKAVNFGNFPLTSGTRVNEKGEIVPTVSLNLKARPKFNLGLPGFSTLGLTSYQENPASTNIFGGAAGTTGAAKVSEVTATPSVVDAAATTNQGVVTAAQGGMIMSDPVMRRAMFRNGGPVSAKGLGITSNVTTPDENAMAMQTMFQPPGFRDGGPVQYFEDGGEAEAPVEAAAPTPLEALRAQVRNPEPRYRSVMDVVRQNREEGRMLPIDDEQAYTGRSMNMLETRAAVANRGRGIAALAAEATPSEDGSPGFFRSVVNRAGEILSGKPKAATAPSAEGADLRQAKAQMRQAIDDRDANDREGLTRVSEEKQTQTPPPDAERKAPVRDRLTIRLDELKAEREANKAQRKENQLLALMQAGFAMAAGRSPNALANISAGGASGVATLADLEKGRRAEDIALRREIVETELAGERMSEARAERQAAREDRTLSRDVAALKSEQDLNARYAIAANSEKRQLNDIIGDNTGKFSEDKKKEAAAQLLVLEQNLRQRELRERELSRALSPRSVQQGSGDFRAREVGSPRPTPQR